MIKNGTGNKTTTILLSYIWPKTANMIWSILINTARRRCIDYMYICPCMMDSFDINHAWTYKYCRRHWDNNLIESSSQRETKRWPLEYWKWSWWRQRALETLISLVYHVTAPALWVCIFFVFSKFILSWSVVSNIFDLSCSCTSTSVYLVLQIHLE